MATRNTFNPLPRAYGITNQGASTTDSPVFYLVVLDAAVGSPLPTLESASANGITYNWEGEFQEALDEYETLILPCAAPLTGDAPPITITDSTKTKKRVNAGKVATHKAVTLTDDPNNIQAYTMAFNNHSDKGNYILIVGCSAPVAEGTDPFILSLSLDDSSGKNILVADSSLIDPTQNNFVEAFACYSKFCKSGEIVAAEIKNSIAEPYPFDYDTEGSKQI